MNKDFNDIYELLYADYIYEYRNRRGRPFPNDEYYYTRIIRKSIDKADSKNRLRPDAKYFLIVNFHHLIVRPLIEQRPFRDSPNEKELYDLETSIQSDIETIILETQTKENESYISGHQIMKTIDNQWANLKTTGHKTWG